MFTQQCLPAHVALLKQISPGVLLNQPEPVHLFHLQDVTVKRSARLPTHSERETRETTLHDMMTPAVPLSLSDPSILSQ